MSRRSIICLSLRLRQIIYLLATDKSRYFAQPRPIIVNYLLRTEITKSHLSNRICQHCGVKTSTVTPSFYYVFNVSLSCNINISSFIGNLWWVLLLGNHLNHENTDLIHIFNCASTPRNNTKKAPYGNGYNGKITDTKSKFLLFGQ